MIVMAVEVPMSHEREKLLKAFALDCCVKKVEKLPTEVLKGVEGENVFSTPKRVEGLERIKFRKGPFGEATVKVMVLGEKSIVVE